jgi:hypothetical protein
LLTGVDAARAADTEAIAETAIVAAANLRKTELFPKSLIADYSTAPAAG